MIIIRTPCPRSFPGLAFDYSVVISDSSVAGLDLKSENWALGKSLPLHQVPRSLPR